MKTLVGGIALLGLAAFMLLGFLQSSATLSGSATVMALLITVGLPAIAGGTLLARRFGAARHRDSRRDQLRSQTLQAEVLRIASGHAGRLALVDVVTELAVDSEDAQGALDALVTREIADIAITDSGTLVYTFRDVERAAEKASARHVLE